MKLLLPRGYLSHQQFHIWNTSKTTYRKDYYAPKKKWSTKATLFGKKIADMLDDGTPDPMLDTIRPSLNLDIYTEPEHVITVDVCGVPTLGRIDRYAPSIFAVDEHKTSMKPWTALMVQKWTQQPFYAVQVEEKYGQVNDLTRLHWIETKKVPIVEEFNGIIIESAKDYNLELTGRVETFERIIDKAERDRMRERIVTCAEEISEDYRRVIESI